MSPNAPKWAPDINFTLDCLLKMQLRYTAYAIPTPMWHWKGNLHVGKLKLLPGTAQRYMASKDFPKYPKSLARHQKLEWNKFIKRSKTLPGRPEEDRHFYRPAAALRSHALISLPLNAFAWNQYSSNRRHYLRTMISHRRFRYRVYRLFRSAKSHSTKTPDRHWNSWKKNFLPHGLFPSFRDPIPSRDTNQTSRAFGCYSYCVEKRWWKDGGRIQLNFSKIRTKARILQLR